MYYVIEHLIEKKNLQLINVVKLEIDYELVTLHDALLTEDKEQVEKSKQTLVMLVKKLNVLTK